MKKYKRRIISIILVIAITIISCVPVSATSLAIEGGYIGVSEFFSWLGVVLGGSYIVEEAPRVINKEGGLFNPITVNRSELDDPVYYEQQQTYIYESLSLTSDVVEWYTAGLFCTVTNADGTQINTSLMEIDGTSALAPKLADIVPFPSGGLSPDPQKDPRKTDKWEKVKSTLDKFLQNKYTLGITNIQIVNNVMTCARYAMAYLALESVNYNDWWSYNGSEFVANKTMVDSIYRNSGTGLVLQQENAFNPPNTIPEGISAFQSYWEDVADKHGLEENLLDNHYIIFRDTLGTFGQNYNTCIVMNKDTTGFTLDFQPYTQYIRFNNITQPFYVFRSNGSGVISTYLGYGTHELGNSIVLPNNQNMYTNFKVSGLNFGSGGAHIFSNGFMENPLLRNHPNSIPMSDIKQNGINNFDYLLDNLTSQNELAKKILEGNLENVNNVKSIDTNTLQVVEPPNYVDLDSFENMGTDVLSAIKKLPSAIVNAFRNLFERVINTLKTAANFITDTIDGALELGFNLVVGGINLAIDGINSLITIVGNIPSLIQNAINVIQTISGYLRSFFTNPLPSPNDYYTFHSRFIAWVDEHFGFNPSDVFLCEERPFSDINFYVRMTNQTYTIPLSNYNTFITTNRHIWSSGIDLFLVFALWALILSMFGITSKE